jgi:O-6-methylguanine DNA methyltransferase
MAIYYNSFLSPIGLIHIAYSLKGICALSLDNREEEEFCHRLASRWMTSPIKDHGLAKELREDILSYLMGKKKDFSQYELDISQATPFQKRVWLEVKKITYGHTRSYQWVAQQIGLPKAYRAVGQANGQNPIPLIIPCHRVVYNDGRLGGYTAGVRLKQRLLDLEKHHQPISAIISG